MDHTCFILLPNEASGAPAEPSRAWAPVICNRDSNPLLLKRLPGRGLCTGPGHGPESRGWWDCRSVSGVPLAPQVEFPASLGSLPVTVTHVSARLAAGRPDTRSSVLLGVSLSSFPDWRLTPLGGREESTLLRVSSRLSAPPPGVQVLASAVPGVQRDFSASVLGASSVQ